MARLVLCVYTAFFIGRVHELFEFLAATRIVLVLGVLAVVSGLLAPAWDKNPVFRQREVRLVLGLLGLALAFFPLGVWPGGSLTFLQETYSRIIVFFLLVVALANSEKAVTALTWSMMAGVAVLGLVTIQGNYTVHALGAGSRAFASSTYDPNEVALVMVCALPFAVGGAVALRGAVRALALGCAAICVLATVMTLSRGGFIGLAFVSLMLLMRLGTGRVGMRLLVAGAAALLLVAGASSQYWDVMSTIWNPTEQGYTERGIHTRMELWIQGLSLLLQNPIMGVGIGMYEVAEGLSHGGLGKWSAAHNSFIQVASELGIIGLALFMSLLATTILSLRSLRQPEGRADQSHGLRWIASACEIALCAFIVVGFALSQAYSPMVYFLLGLATAIRIQTETVPCATPVTHGSWTKPA